MNCSNKRVINECVGKNSSRGINLSNTFGSLTRRRGIISRCYWEIRFYPSAEHYLHCGMMLPPSMWNAKEVPSEKNQNEMTVHRK